jgi:hypothetical protein
VKPSGPFEPTKFPKTDYFFHQGFGEWGGCSGNDDWWEVRRFHNLGREFLIEARRERAKEMAVFGLVVLASAWPVIYMIVSVIQVLLKGRPIDH